MLYRSSEQNRGFAQALLKNLVLREKSRAQALFLEELSQTPLFHQLILRGSCALHGVFLGKRHTKDIDFIASPEVASTFYQQAREFGLPLERVESEPDVPAYVLTGKLFERVAVGIDVWERSAQCLVWELATLTFPLRTEISVRAQPLAHILVDKLASATRRCYAVDFLDLWFGLASNETLVIQVREVLGQRVEVYFDVEKALEHLNSLEDEWEESLDALLWPIPPFEVVRRDLCELLPFFAEAPASLPSASDFPKRPLLR